MLGNNLAFNRAISSSSGGGINTIITLIAGEALGYPRVVSLSGGKAFLFDPVTATPGTILGITNQSATLNANVPITISGSVTYVGWGLVLNTLQFAVASGLLSSTAPSIGQVQAIGLALNTDTLLLRPSSVIELI